MAHRWSLLVKEFLHFGLHAGRVVIHDEEEGDRASTREVLQGGMDTGFKAIKEEGVQLDDVLMEGQFAEDLILTSKLVTNLHTQRHKRHRHSYSSSPYCACMQKHYTPLYIQVAINLPTHIYTCPELTYTRHGLCVVVVDESLHGVHLIRLCEGGAFACHF